MSFCLPQVCSDDMGIAWTTPPASTLDGPPSPPSLLSSILAQYSNSTASSYSTTTDVQQPSLPAGVTQQGSVLVLPLSLLAECPTGEQLEGLSHKHGQGVGQLP
jgi:hypothetical protein